MQNQSLSKSDDSQVEAYLSLLKTLQNESSMHLSIVGDVILKDYLPRISDLEIIPYDRTDNKIYFQELSSIVYEKGLPFQECMTTVYSALHNGVSQIVFLISKHHSEIKFYIGVGSSNNVPQALLDKVLRAGFPGIKTIPKRSDDEYLDETQFKIRNSRAVALVSSYASNRIKNQEGQFIQGIEKLLEIMDDHITIVLIADKQSNQDTTKFRNICERIATAVSINQEMNISVSASHSRSFAHSVSKSIGETTGISIGNGSPISMNVSDQTNHTEQNTDGLQNAMSGQISYKRNDKTIQQLLTRIDNHLRYIAEGEDYGMWNFAAYFVGNKESAVQIPANVYNGLIKGDSTGRMHSIVEIFSGDKAVKMCEYLAQFQHPKYKYKYSHAENANGKFDCIDATNMVSSKELAIQMSLPQKSLPGLLVEEQVVFGRNVIPEFKSERELLLGMISHLGRVDGEIQVNLDIEQLRSHALITGSTGSGKSNTIYKMLQELPSDISYMVIEPAKGEYKRVLQGEGVCVYGTDPRRDVLLKLNPFRFPKEVHVLAHIDRLLDIFNVCWPMYAAMPAVLKESIIRAYRNCGWNLVYSMAPYNIYPTFKDVLEELHALMNDSEYSSDTKGDYKGALEMRLSSLTNGINGLIFSGEEISLEDLFDRRVIVDLSAVGSSETKAMIMGILILKLNEYRNTSSRDTNSNLQHLTILEEAHNILKKTSTAQSSESANLIGKSVEMIANSIAEMRTYGEGFLIVDQSPSALDPAAIRNTNTKIIMALPDQTDRVLVGKAAALSDKQIEALAKLKVGQAVVYQNSWLEAVLCKVDKAAESSLVLHGPSSIDNSNHGDMNFMRHLVAVWRDENNNLIPLNVFRNDLETMTIGSSITKYKILEYYTSRCKYAANESDSDISRDDSAEILVDLLGPEPMTRLKGSKDVEEFEYKTLLEQELYRIIPYECRNIFDNLELTDIYIYGYIQKYC